MLTGEIDLHLHSTASDGTETPRSLVRMAKQMGLAAISITDHDTTEAVSEAQREGRRSSVEVIPGIEIGSHFEGNSVHILGYFVDVESPVLREFVQQKREARKRRAIEIVRRLRSAGLPIDEEAVFEAAGSGVVGRVQIARVLVANGVVGSVSEAFASLLRRGSPYYVALTKPSPQEAVSLVKRAGGIASLAHPVFLEERIVERLVPMLSKAGLAGIEVLCGFDPAAGLTAEDHLRRCAEMMGFATDYGLVPTGGSDYHGLSVKATGMGSAHVPVQFLEDLKAAYRNRDPAQSPSGGAPRS